MSAQADLYYFDGRGKAEIVRLTMAATGVKFTPHPLYERAQFEQLKTDGKLLFGQLPLVEFEGKRFVQTGATTRFFARRGGLFGTNPDEEVKIDILYEGSRDFFAPLLSYGFETPENAVNKAKQVAMPKYLPIYEKVLTENGSNGYLVGSKLSLADVGLLEVLLLIEDYIGADELKPYPNVQKFYDNVRSLPQIKEYLSGPLRPRKNDEKYIADVKRILNW